MLSSAYPIFMPFPARFSIPPARAYCPRIFLNASPTGASGVILIPASAAHLIWRQRAWTATDSSGIRGGVEAVTGSTKKETGPSKPIHSLNDQLEHTHDATVVRGQTGPRI